jgi:hypothetical protein
MTAWALGPRDEAVVIGQFLGELQAWQEFQDELQPQFDTLKAAINDADTTLLMVRLDNRMSQLMENLAQIGVQVQTLAQSLRKQEPADVITRQRDQIVASLKFVRQGLDDLTKLAKCNPQAKDFCGRLHNLETQLGVDENRLAEIKDLRANDVEKMLATGSSPGDGPTIASLAKDTAAAMKSEAQQPLNRVAEATKISLDNRRKSERSAAEKERFYEQIQKR